MLKRNLIANYLGQGWVGLIGLLFIPIYIKYLGIEAYGLIGLFSVLQALLSLLDMGMTPTLSREMARFTGGNHTSQSMRDLLRSIEFIGIGIALMVGLCIWASSEWLASHWLRTEKLPSLEVADAFAVMGFVTALRFIEGIYRGAIIGLQRQVIFNILNGILATIRSVGVVGVLVWVSPTIEAFFIWQGISSLLTLVALASLTYRTIPKARRSGQFSISALRDIGQFAGGMMAITFLALLLTQADKILLSKLLTLSEYGYYTLAAVVASSLYMLTGPITQAWFPRLTELYVMGDQEALITKYHQGAQLVSVFMGSAAIVLIIFAEPILKLWTRDSDLAYRTSDLLRLLAMGNLLNGLMWIPYQTQLAHGWTSLAVYINLALVVIIVPAIFFITPLYGAEGAAWAWLGLNIVYVVVGIDFMHRKILINEKWHWYRKDVLKPLLVSVAIAILLRWMMPDNLTFIYELIWLFVSSSIILLVSVFTINFLRSALLRWLGELVETFAISKYL